MATISEAWLPLASRVTSHSPGQLCFHRWLLLLHSLLGPSGNSFHKVLLVNEMKPRDTNMLRDIIYFVKIDIVSAESRGILAIFFLFILMLQIHHNL